MGTRTTYKCQTCHNLFTARVVDRKRGWARYCSKSCKAIKQTQRAGYSGPRDYNHTEGGMSGYDNGWDSHKYY